MYAKAGAAGAALSVETQGKLYDNYLVSPAGRQGYRDYHALREESRGQLQQANSIIATLNSEKSSRTSNTILAVLAAAGGAAASFQESQVRSQIQSQGYATDSQINALQTAKLNQFNSDLMLKMTAGAAGAWGEKITLMRAAANPTMFQQFTSLDAGMNPNAIISEFAKRGSILGAGNSALIMRATQLTQENKKMEEARKSGDAQAAQGAYGSFLPALTKFTDELKRVRR